MFCIHEATAEERESPRIQGIVALSVYEPDQFRNLERAVRLYDRDGSHLLVGTLYGRPVGILGYHVQDAELSILHLAVQEDYRGRNLGRRLVECVISSRPGARVVAETDRDAVGFYRACLFRTESLGEKYPGVERFLCTFGGPATGAQAGSREEIQFDELPQEQIELIRPLWSRLNTHHYRQTLGWKDHFARFTFEARIRRLSDERKRVRIDVARDGRNGGLIGYNMSSIDVLGAGEIESIFVDDAYRGLGVGETLARRGLSWLEDNDAHDITIVVAVGNEAALPFYEKLGFLPRTYRLKRMNRQRKPGA